MGETIVQSIRSKDVGLCFFTFRGVILPALRGEQICQKRTPNGNLTIVLLNLVHQPFLRNSYKVHNIFVFSIVITAFVV